MVAGKRKSSRARPKLQPAGKARGKESVEEDRGFLNVKNLVVEGGAAIRRSSLDVSSRKQSSGGNIGNDA